jgi:hypothetical protein
LFSAAAATAAALKRIDALFGNRRRVEQHVSAQRAESLV